MYRSAGVNSPAADGAVVTLEPHPSCPATQAPSVGDEVVLRMSRTYGRVIAYVNGKPVGVLPSATSETIDADYLRSGQRFSCRVTKSSIVKYVGMRIQIRIAGVVASDPNTQSAMRSEV